MRMLFIDDEPVLGQIIREYFSLFPDYSIEVEQYPLQAVARQDIASFDLILVDFNMPEMNGEQVASKLRTSGYSRPIVMLSSVLPFERTKNINLYLDKADSCSDLELLMHRIKQVVQQRVTT